MVDDISEARDISGRSEGPTANLTESKTDENLWYVIQKIRQIAAYIFFLCGRGPEEKFCNEIFSYFFYRASVLSEVQTSRNSQLPASKNLLVLGKKTVFWFFVKSQNSGKVICRCLLTEKCFSLTYIFYSRWKKLIFCQYFVEFINPDLEDIDLVKLVYLILE